MSGFWGSYSSKLDGKGRITFPAKFRKNLKDEDQDTLILVRGNEGCISCYPLSAWEEKVQQIRQSVSSDREYAIVARQLMYQASEQTIDKQGRLNLTNELIKFAELNSDVMLIGHENKIEIWNRQKYEQLVKATELDYLKITSQLDI
jgi:MraZ protein